VKKALLIFAAATALVSPALAGEETESKEMKEPTLRQAFCDWYAHREWNASVWGTYAFTGNDWPDDRYLGVDHAWGGGADIKFFFARYFGIGAEGYLLDAHDTVGAALGTLTFRYPIPCSRLAPYVYAGGGAIFGDEDEPDFFRPFHDDSKAIGQFGGGLEIRLTPHLGIIHDFNWNVIDGHDNNFGMVRTGISFAF
jgi:hypothetical protein